MSIAIQEDVSSLAQEVFSPSKSHLLAESAGRFVPAAASSPTPSPLAALAAVKRAKTRPTRSPKAGIADRRPGVLFKVSQQVARRGLDVTRFPSQYAAFLDCKPAAAFDERDSLDDSCPSAHANSAAASSSLNGGSLTAGASPTKRCSPSHASLRSNGGLRFADHVFSATVPHAPSAVLCSSCRTAPFIEIYEEERFQLCIACVTRLERVKRKCIACHYIPKPDERNRRQCSQCKGAVQCL